MQLPTKPKPQQKPVFVPAGNLKNQFELLSKSTVQDVVNVPSEIIKSIPEQLVGFPQPDQANSQQAQITQQEVQKKENKGKRRFQALQSELQDIRETNRRRELEARQRLAQEEQAKKTQTQEEGSVILETGSKIKRGVMGAAGAAKKHLQNKQQHLERPKQSST